jgi:hypothetical protein
MFRGRIQNNFPESLVFIYLIFASASYIAIPFYLWRGLDLHNLFVFHNCGEFSNNPYIFSKTNCGDVSNRPMIYPPILYWSFAWMRLVSFRVAEKIWEIAIFGFISSSLALVYHMTPAKRGQIGALFFGLLLILQFPMMFAMERGNVDALMVGLWVLGAWAFSKSKNYLGWACVTHAAAFKLYPVFGVLVLILGQIFAKNVQAKVWIKTHIKPLVAASVLLLFYCILSYDMTIDYFFNILPKFTGRYAEIAFYSHSVPALLESHLILKLLSWFLLCGSWSFLVCKRILTDSFFVICGILSITTFFAGMSFDYNLITAYPLLFALYLRASSKRDWVVLMTGLLFFTGQAGFFLAQRFVRGFPEGLHIASMMGWLIFVAIYLALGLGFEMGSESNREALPA